METILREATLQLEEGQAATIAALGVKLPGESETKNRFVGRVVWPHAERPRVETMHFRSAVNVVLGDSWGQTENVGVVHIALEDQGNVVLHPDSAFYRLGRVGVLKPHPFTVSHGVGELIVSLGSSYPVRVDIKSRSVEGHRVYISDALSNKWRSELNNVTR